MLPFSEFHFANFSVCSLKVNMSPSVCRAAHLPVRDIKRPRALQTFLGMSGPVGHLIRLCSPLSVTALPFLHSACRADILICHNRLCSTGLSLTNSENSHICFVSPDSPLRLARGSGQSRRDAFWWCEAWRKNAMSVHQVFREGACNTYLWWNLWQFKCRHLCCKGDV